MIMINILLLENLISSHQKIKTRGKTKTSKLESKNDIANFVKKTNFHQKLKNVTSNKNELKEL